MSTRQRASEQIVETVTSWPGVAAGPGRRGELAFKVGGREIGHLHGDHAAHFGFPKEVWGSRSSSKGASTITRSSPAGRASAPAGSRAEADVARRDRADAPELRPGGRTPRPPDPGSRIAVCPLASSPAPREVSASRSSAHSRSEGGGSSSTLEEPLRSSEPSLTCTASIAIAGRRRRPSAPPGARRSGGRSHRPARQQRGRARPEPAARARRLPARRARARLRGQRLRPARARPRCSASAHTRRGHPRRHLGCGGRAVRGLGRLRLFEGRPRAADCDPRGRAAAAARLHRRPGRHAHADVPGGLPRRGHLSTCPCRRRACPACSR